MILKGFGIKSSLMLKGLVGWWEEVWLALRYRLFTLSLLTRNFIVSLRYKGEELSLSPKIPPLHLRRRTFDLSLPELEE